MLDKMCSFFAFSTIFMKYGLIVLSVPWQ